MNTRLPGYRTSYRPLRATHSSEHRSPRVLPSSDRVVEDRRDEHAHAVAGEQGQHQVHPAEADNLGVALPKKSAIRSTQRDAIRTIQENPSDCSSRRLAATPAATQALSSAHAASGTGVAPPKYLALAVAAARAERSREPIVDTNVAQRPRKRVQRAKRRITHGLVEDGTDENV